MPFFGTVPSVNEFVATTPEEEEEEEEKEEEESATVGQYKTKQNKKTKKRDINREQYIFSS